MSLWRPSWLMAPQTVNIRFLSKEAKNMVAGPLDVQAGGTLAGRIKHYPRDLRGIKQKEKGGSAVNVRRHETRCSICSHVLRREIEQCWVDGNSPSGIANAYRLGRSSLYRHARALKLARAEAKRRGSDVAMPTGSVFLSALEQCAKADTGTEASWGADLKTFDKMSEMERQALVKEVTKQAVLAYARW